MDIAEARRAALAETERTSNGRIPDSPDMTLATRFKSRKRLEAENVILRQQVTVLSRKSSDAGVSPEKLIGLSSYRYTELFPSILDAVVVVKPETVIRWHLPGFQAYWHWKSRGLGGRPKVGEMRAAFDRYADFMACGYGAPFFNAASREILQGARKGAVRKERSLARREARGWLGAASEQPLLWLGERPCGANAKVCSCLRIWARS
jgi:hypothetical protein